MSAAVFVIMLIPLFPVCAAHGYGSTSLLAELERSTQIHSSSTILPVWQKDCTEDVLQVLSSCLVLGNYRDNPIKTTFWGLNSSFLSTRSLRIFLETLS